MFFKRTLIAKLFCTNMTYPMSLIMTIFDMPSYYESHNIKYGSAKVFFDCKFFTFCTIYWNKFFRFSNGATLQTKNH